MFTVTLVVPSLGERIRAQHVAGTLAAAMTRVVKFVKMATRIVSQLRGQVSIEGRTLTVRLDPEKQIIADAKTTANRMRHAMHLNALMNQQLKKATIKRTSILNRSWPDV